MHLHRLPPKDAWNARTRQLQRVAVILRRSRRKGEAVLAAIVLLAAYRCGRWRRPGSPSGETIAFSGERKPSRGRNPCTGSRPWHLREGAEPCRPRAAGSRTRAKAGRAFPHMDDVPTVAAEVVIVVRKVRADGGEGLAGGASVHERLFLRIQSPRGPLVNRTRAQSHRRVQDDACSSLIRFLRRAYHRRSSFS